MDGTFKIRLRRGEGVNLRVKAEGYAPLERPYLLAGEYVKVELTPGVHLAVTCKDEKGAPVEDVQMRLSCSGRPGDLNFQYEGSSDESGLFRFDNLPPSVKVTLACEHARLAYGWHRFELPDHGTKTYEVTLPNGRTISGRVTDATTGEPIVGARVGMGWWLVKAVTTDEEGRYTLDG